MFKRLKGKLFSQTPTLWQDLYTEQELLKQEVNDNNNRLAKSSAGKL